MNVLFAGEGSDELGEWAQEPAYRPTDGIPEGGVLHALVARIRQNCVARDGIRWKAIRKFKAGNHASPEARNVLGLALRAEELGCVALAFVRDRDRDEDREADVESGIELATERFAGVRIVGGTANEEIEAWLLALLGERGSERHANAKSVLAARGIDTRVAKVDVVDNADLVRVAEDCVSFARWAGRARAALGA